MEKLVIGLFQILEFRPIPVPIHPAPFHFIVPTPQRQAGAMAQAADILDHLHVNIFKEIRVIQRVNTAGKDKLLPDQDAIAIAQIVKTLILIKSAAPDTQHVLVGLGRRADQSFQIFVRDAGGERIGRDPVGAFGKDGNAVDDKNKGASPFILLLAQFNGPQPNW